MNIQRTKTTERIFSIAAFLLACLMLMPAQVKAHGDLIHVIGTVTQVSDGAVSVKTKDGKVVEVQFSEKTTYQRVKASVDKGSIKVGDRIVIHAAKGKDGKLVAHTIELGAAHASQKGTK